MTALKTSYIQQAERSDRQTDNTHSNVQVSLALSCFERSFQGTNDNEGYQQQQRTQKKYNYKLGQETDCI